MKSIIIFILFNYLSDVVIADNGWENYQAKEKDFVLISYFNDCEGKDSMNYTIVASGALTPDCGTVVRADDYLISIEKKSEPEVNGILKLASSQYPLGAFGQIETIALVTYGPLQGKYIYVKSIYLSATYLKKCSSVLGFSYVTAKSAVLLIADKLDLNTFIEPTDGFHTFKKSSSTVCRGKIYIF